MDNGAGSDHAPVEYNGAQSPVSSQRLLMLDVVGTGAFVVSAVVAAAVFNGPTRAIGVVVALILFTIGIFAFIWSYITAVQRSRQDNIAVAQLYFLVSGSTPRRVQRVMLGALAVQVVVAFTTAILRSRTDGRAGSTLAFGILVPMFGIGLNGLWCSRHGRFSPRQLGTTPVEQVAPGTPAAGPDTNSPSVPPSDDQMEQNSHHG